MNNVKRLLALMMALCVTFCLFACGGGGDKDTAGTTQSTQGSTQSTQGSTQSTQGTSETTTTTDGKVDYKVTVLYPDGTPVEGAYVQICLEDLCYNPAATDADGVATFHLKEQEGYKTKLAMAVEGYLHEDYIYFESGSYEITITLVPEE